MELRKRTAGFGLRFEGIGMTAEEITKQKRRNYERDYHKAWYQKQKELSAILPIYRYANNGKVKKFETIDEINKARYSCNKILIAIQSGTAYRDCIWKRGETID